jgi:hypothetical protein
MHRLYLHFGLASLCGESQRTGFNSGILVPVRRAPLDPARLLVLCPYDHFHHSGRQALLGRLDSGRNQQCCGVSHRFSHRAIWFYPGECILPWAVCRESSLLAQARGPLSTQNWQRSARSLVTLGVANSASRAGIRRKLFHSSRHICTKTAIDSGLDAS